MLKPDAPCKPSCGLTTQKRVLRFKNFSDPLLNSAVNMILEKSSLNLICSTIPISTFLYLTFVLPTSIPSAVLKLILTWGPCSESVLKTSQLPTNNVTTGIIQTTEGPDRLFTFGFEISILIFILVFL